MRTLTGQLNTAIKDASVLVLNPPPIRGLSTTGGFTFVLQDRGGADLSAVFPGVAGFSRARPASGPRSVSCTAGSIRAFHRSSFVIDRDKVKSLDIRLSDVFFTLQTFLGGYYVNDFNLFGRTYKVLAQADGHAARATRGREPLLCTQRGRATMVPLSTLVTSRLHQRPAVLRALQRLWAATINGNQRGRLQLRPGNRRYGGGGRAHSRTGFGYEWSEATYQEKKTGGQTGYIFALSLLFVFLVLAALYESWTMPVAILLVIPFGVFGAFLGLLLRSLDNNVYTQVGLIMLIGLAAKNAILIVEFAKLKRDQGEPIVQAALDGAKLRLRPILMTSFAFILGSLPLAIAFGAGAGARQAIGTTVVFGMLVATLIGVFFIPVFYVMLQRLSERQWPFRHSDDIPSAGGPAAGEGAGKGPGAAAPAHGHS